MKRERLKYILHRDGKKEREERMWIKEVSRASTLDTSHESRLWKPVAKSTPHLLALEDPRTKSETRCARLASKSVRLDSGNSDSQRKMTEIF